MLSLLGTRIMRHTQSVVASMCNSTCGMYLSLTLQHGIIGIDIHEVYFNNSNTWSASPYPRARGTPLD